MIEYLLNHPDKIGTPFLEHIELVLLTLLFSVALAALLTVWSVYAPGAGRVLLQLFSAVYSIPSLALFALMIPLTGLGRTTTLIVLTAYNQFLLLRNFLTGLNEVDAGVMEAAKGIGMTKGQILTRVQIPLAKQALFAGVRLAVVSTIGIATIAALINAGGLGSLILDGLRTSNVIKILWGSLLSALLAITVNALLQAAERHLKRKTNDVA